MSRPRATRHGAVTVVQRFDGTLSLNVHFHSMVTDGVWVDSPRGPRFEPLRVTEADVRWVVNRVWRLAPGLCCRGEAWPGDKSLYSQ